MENNLALEIFDLEGTGSQFFTLDEGASISITDTSEIFASGDVWSFSFTLNVFANAHIFGTTGEIHGSRLHEQIDHRRVRLWVMGLPIYLGYIKLGDEVDVKANGDVSVSFESGHKTFDDMIEGMSAQDVSVGDVVIGVALNRKRPVTNVHVTGNVMVKGIQAGGAVWRAIDWFNTNAIPFDFVLSDSALTQRWPKLVMSKGVITNRTGASSVSENIDYTRTNPYDGTLEHSYCSVNICYQKKVTVKNDNTNNTTGSSSTSGRIGNQNSGTEGLRGGAAATAANGGTEQKVRGYTVRLGRGANTTDGGDGETRYNNAPNFYLLHWLKRLFIDKGIIIEENQMMLVEDLKRIFLANLGCFYEEMDTDSDKVENYTRQETEKWNRYGLYDFPTYFVQTASKYYPDDEDKATVYDTYIEDNGEKIDAKVEVTDIAVTSDTGEITGYLAYATGENYPKVDASEIIKSVEAAFGVRFLFDKDYTKVRIILLRNVFQDTTVQNIECEVIEEQKTENKIRGFMLSYGGSDDDTTYNYSDWSRLDTSKTYQQIKDRYVTSFNKTCYLTPNNGNAYRIKIDEDEEIQYYYPVLMEVAGYADAKDGNCDGEDDTIQTVAIPAKPLIMNDVDGTYAVFFSGDMKAPDDVSEIQCQIPSGTIDQTLQVTVQVKKYREEVIPNPGRRRRSSGSDVPEYITQITTYYENETHNIHLVAGVTAKEGYIINLKDRYDFSGNDATPFDKAEIGLQFGIMRGSGANAVINYIQDTAEGEGNDYWEDSQGSETIAHPDTCDNYGNEWDYNGTGEGIGSREGRFSLKPRAEKQNPDFDPKKPETHYDPEHPEQNTNPRFVADITNPNLRRRGLMDQFYKEYSYWIRNARIVTKKVNMTLAQLLSIDKTKRIRIGDVTGYVRKIQYTVSNKTGLGPVTLEIMYI